MQAFDIMRRRVLTISPDATVHEAAEKLVAYGISAMPVVDSDGKLIGMVSEGDLMRRAELGAEPRSSWWLNFLADPKERADDYLKSHGHCVKDVMTKDVVTVSEDASIPEIATLLERNNIKRVPVMRDGKVVGIVSRANLLRALVAQESAEAPPLSDREIREQFLKEVNAAGIRHEFAEIIVSDGIVHLWGAAHSDTEKTALRTVAEDIPGVASVEDNIVILSRAVRSAMGRE